MLTLGIVNDGTETSGGFESDVELPALPTNTDTALPEGVGTVAQPEAARFEVSLFLGKGKYANGASDTREGIEAEAARLKTENPTAKGEPVIVAFDAEGNTIGGGAKAPKPTAKEKAKAKADAAKAKAKAKADAAKLKAKEKADREKAKATAAKAKGSKPKGDDAPKAPKEGSKLDLVVGMLKAEGGTTVPKIMEATGWLPHTTRAFLSATLKKKGFNVTAEKTDDGRFYKIV